MKTRKPLLLCLLASTSMILVANANVPPEMSYQGKVTVDGEPFDGEGEFKFAIVDDGTENVSTAEATANVNDGLVTSLNIENPGNGYLETPNVTIEGGGGSGAEFRPRISDGQIVEFNLVATGSGYTSEPTVTIQDPPVATIATLWSNDGSSSGAAEPDTSVSLEVSEGIFSVNLGDVSLEGMSESLSTKVFANHPVFLRVWFDDGEGFQQVVPDQPLSSSPYAFTAEFSAEADLAAEAASVLDGSIGTDSLDNMGASEGQILLFDGSGWSVEDRGWANADEGIFYEDGFVGINTDEPQHDLHIYQSLGSQEGGIRLYRNSSSDGEDWGLWNSDTTNNLHFRYEGGLRAWIEPDEGTYNETSDRNLKTDIRGMDELMPKVVSLEPVRYRYLEGEKDNIGFIAQDVKDLFPELVSYESSNDLYGLSYSGFSVIAIQAIQEQQETIESQEARITELEAQLAEQENIEARLTRLEESLEGVSGDDTAQLSSP